MFNVKYYYYASDINFVFSLLNAIIDFPVLFSCIKFRVFSRQLSDHTSFYVPLLMAVYLILITLCIKCYVTLIKSPNLNSPSHLIR